MSFFSVPNSLFSIKSKSSGKNYLGNSPLRWDPLVFSTYISPKPKIDVCILLTPASALLLRFIYTLRSHSFFLYSLTSSSDQKSNDFRQNTSTILGLFVFASGTNGKQNIGSDPSVTFVIFSSLSSAISICLPLLAHSA